ncbi:MAG TPA: SGNH/GDSL hydrolase family protein [Cyclobacteriaceae bacterium]
MIVRTIALAFFCVLTFATTGQRKVSILFVGNSLTYSNNLPELVKRIAMCDGVDIRYHTIALPNYALVDHWNDETVIHEINSGKYNIVVVQQGPSSQQEGKGLLLDFGLKLDSLCDRKKAQLAVFMVWPSKVRSSDFPGVYASYKLLADSSRSIFCPAGSAWQTLWKKHPEFKLYGADNFHPGFNGSLLSALVIYGSIMKKSNLKFVTLDKIKEKGLASADFDKMIHAAEQTLNENR